MAMYLHPHLARHWLLLGSFIAGGLSAATLAVIGLMSRRRPSPEQREERRRRQLAETGRIVDGSVIEAEPSEGDPRAVFYRYRIAGVTYECSQDVSTLPSLVRDLRLDYPVQVRYNRANPADSIIVAETWNGLWTNIWSSSGARSSRVPHASPQLTQQNQH